MVVMRRTRNAFVRKGTRVRIPPSPLFIYEKSRYFKLALFYFKLSEQANMNRI